jgi:hypothetical protein
MSETETGIKTGIVEKKYTLKPEANQRLNICSNPGYSELDQNEERIRTKPKSELESEFLLRNWTQNYFLKELEPEPI